MENIEYIAIFCSYGGILPDGCPKELKTPNIASRKALAAWLLDNCRESVVDEFDNITVFEYLSSLNVHIQDWPTRMAVVPVDVSRPWLLHRYDGKERIWYLDQVDESNQVVPVVFPKSVSHEFERDFCMFR